MTAPPDPGAEPVGVPPALPAPVPLPPRQGDDWAEVLEPGERLLWHGRPDPGVRLRWTNLPLIIVGVVIALLAVLFLREAAGAIATGDEAGGQMVGFGLLLAGFGLWCIAGPTLIDTLERRKTAYALTDRRALIEIRFLGKGLVAWPIGPNNPLFLRRGTPGSVIFAILQRRVGVMDALRLTPRHKSEVVVGFDFIPDAEAVHGMLQQVQATARATCAKASPTPAEDAP